jgi:hypothetical protein
MPPASPNPAARSADARNNETDGTRWLQISDHEIFMPVRATGVCLKNAQHPKGLMRGMQTVKVDVLRVIHYILKLQRK